MKEFIYLLFVVILVSVIVASVINRQSTSSVTSEEVIMTGQTNQVTYQAKLYRFSSSGDMRFKRTNKATLSANRFNDRDEWFFALPANVPSDPIATTAWVKFIKDNQNAVFNITGEKMEPDCDHYGFDHCIESIIVTDIIVNR